MRQTGRFQGLSSLRIISSNSLWPGFFFDVLKRKKKLGQPIKPTVQVISLRQPHKK